MNVRKLKLGDDEFLVAQKRRNHKHIINVNPNRQRMRECEWVSECGWYKCKENSVDCVTMYICDRSPLTWNRSHKRSKYNNTLILFSLLLAGCWLLLLLWLSLVSLNCDLTTIARYHCELQKCSWPISFSLSIYLSRALIKYELRRWGNVRTKYVKMHNASYERLLISFIHSFHFVSFRRKEWYGFLLA